MDDLTNKGTQEQTSRILQYKKEEMEDKRCNSPIPYLQRDAFERIFLTRNIKSEDGYNFALFCLPQQQRGPTARSDGTGTCAVHSPRRAPPQQTTAAGCMWGPGSDGCDPTPAAPRRGRCRLPPSMRRATTALEITTPPSLSPLSCMIILFIIYNKIPNYYIF